MIYHLTTESELRLCTKEGRYLPASLDDEGFVHCAEADSVLPVANDFFRGSTERVLVLEIRPDRLLSEVRFEAPAPLAGGSSHLQGVSLFPHVYGPIELDAIERIGVLVESDAGFEWPKEWLQPTC